MPPRQNQETVLLLRMLQRNYLKESFRTRIFNPRMIKQNIFIKRFCYPFLKYGEKKLLVYKKPGFVSNRGNLIGLMETVPRHLHRKNRPRIDFSANTIN